jgi:hypothetical protein
LFKWVASENGYIFASGPLNSVTHENLFLLAVRSPSPPVIFLLARITAREKKGGVKKNRFFSSD